LLPTQPVDSEGGHVGPPNPRRVELGPKRHNQQHPGRQRQAASRCGQEQLHGEVHENRLEPMVAVHQVRPALPFCYRTTLTDCSSFGASSPLRSGCLKENRLLGLKGTKTDVLDGRTSSTNRAFASNRSIKISASIATTFRIKQPNSDVVTLDLSLRKTVIGSTPFV